jgi:hypothetical protein
VIVFAAILASMAYLGFHKVSHGLNLSDVTLTGNPLGMLKLKK